MVDKKTIGVLTPILDGFYFGNLIKSISHAAGLQGAKVVVIGTSARHYTDTYAVDYVDGWVVIMDAVDDTYIEQLRKRGKPIIGINTRLKADCMLSVNNREMMNNAVNHLVRHGHRRIAYVGDRHFYDASERYEGYVEALSAHQIEPDPYWFYNTHQMSVTDIAKAMAEDSSRCTAIVAVNDLIAIELINHFQALHVKVPDDIAIMSVDDVPIAKSIAPALSTFSLPVNDLGTLAAEALLNSWNDAELHPNNRYVSASIRIRESCGCKMEHREALLEESTGTIQYLTNMVSRNFNLGLLMQSYTCQETVDMSWLNHTPFRKGFVALKDRKMKGAYAIHDFDLEQQNRLRDVENSYHLHQFPPYEDLHSEEFMGEENVVVVVPVVLDKEELGTLALVGLGDMSTQLYPYNTTFQLAEFFASALQREAISAELQSYAKQLEIISNITNDGVWELDMVTNEFQCKGGIYKILGYASDQPPIAISEVFELVHPADLSALIKSVKQHMTEGGSFENESRILDASGHYIWMQIAGHAQFDHFGNLFKLIGSVKDISGRKKAEERISQLAYEDSLTGLANRYSFERQLDALIRKARMKDKKIAILLFDLDRFKLINDSYGHHAGDRLLQYVAEKVRSISPSEYVLVRMGGDEFVIVMPHIGYVEEALDFGAQLVNCWSEPFYDGVREYYISCSIGISIFPDHGANVDTIVKHADIAMYSAKARGRNRLQLYTPELNERHATRLEMENDLRKALKRNELVVYYQPLYDLAEGCIYGVEALLRWNSPKYGLVSPMDFIPLAEDTGLIIPIGDWVLREACLLNKHRREKGLRPLKVSVNISTRQLNQSDFVMSIRKALKETGANPEDICLELTETIMLEDLSYSQKILQELNQLGVSMSMDDFGTGYSSLSLLKSLPIRILKIDKSFIHDISASAENLAIVQAIITLSHVMSIKVVAEGVETKEQMELLEELKVDYIQGYYIHKPLPVEALDDI